MADREWSERLEYRPEGWMVFTVYVDGAWWSISKDLLRRNAPWWYLRSSDAMMSSWTEDLFAVLPELLWPTAFDLLLEVERG